LVTISWKLVTTWRNVSPSVVHNKLELLSHLNPYISFKALKSVIPHTSLLDSPWVRVSELTKHLNCLMLLHLLVISINWLKIYSGFEYAHHFVSPHLSKQPQSPYSLGDNYRSSHSVLLDSFLHSLFELDVYQ
jgi:hypothetical protein